MKGGNKMCIKIFGYISVLVGVLCGCVLYNNLCEGKFDWQLINIITCPVNIILGVRLAIS